MICKRPPLVAKPSNRSAELMNRHPTRFEYLHQGRALDRLPSHTMEPSWPSTAYCCAWHAQLWPSSSPMSMWASRAWSVDTGWHTRLNYSSMSQARPSDPKDSTPYHQRYSATCSAFLDDRVQTIPKSSHCQTQAPSPIHLFPAWHQRAGSCLLQKRHHRRTSDPKLTCHTNSGWLVDKDLTMRGGKSQPDCASTL